LAVASYQATDHALQDFGKEASAEWNQPGKSGF
jgi:hypothetical protein